MIKTYTGAAIAALLMAPFAAHAADLPQPYKAAPGYVAPLYANWTGFYAGLNAGYGFGQSNWTAPGATVNTSPKGVLAGLTLGYNLQTGVWVWGAEGDIDWSNMKGDADCGGGVTCTTKANWFGTLRGRVGYAGWNNLLPYLTGGLAVAGLKAETNPGDTTSSTRLGWTAGAGLEYAFAPNWTAKIEYDYLGFGNQTLNLPTPAFPTYSTNASLNVQEVKAGINFKFGP